MAIFEDGNLHESFAVYVDWEHSQFHNHIRNSSFNFFRSSGEIIGWERTTNNSGGTISTANIYNGIANYRITGTGVATEGELQQGIFDRMKTNRDYILSVYIDLSVYTSGSVIIKVRSDSQGTDYATLTRNSTTAGYIRLSTSFTSPGDLPEDMKIIVYGDSFNGTVDIDAVCLEEESVLGILPYTPFETYRPVAGTLDFQEGVTELESDITGYVDMTTYVTSEGIDVSIETPKSGSIVVNRGSVGFANFELGLSPKIFTAYDPSAGLFNGQDHGDGKGNVRTGRRIIITATAFDGTDTVTAPVFSGTIEVPKDSNMDRKAKLTLWGRAYTLQKNKINFTRLNRANNLVLNSGFELNTVSQVTQLPDAPIDWVLEDNGQTVDYKVIANSNFGLLAPQLTGTATADTTVGLSQALKDKAGNTITLNGTYRFRARVKGTNGTANPSILGIRIVATSGSFTSGVSVSTYTGTAAGYVEVETSFTTVGPVEATVYVEGFVVNGNAFDFSFDNVHLVQSFESADYDTGISFISKELLKALGFGTADFNIVDDFKIIEFFQVNNETPLKRLAEMLQVSRLIFHEDEYGRINIRPYSEYIAAVTTARTLDLSHFRADGIQASEMPAYTSVLIEADPVVAHDTFGKRIEAGSVIGDQLNQAPGERIRIENLDEVFLNHLSVGKLEADSIDVGLITAEQVLTSGGGSDRIDINITTPNRMTFYDSNGINVMSYGTSGGSSLYTGGAGSFLQLLDTTGATTPAEGILVKVRSGGGAALIAETGTSFAASNAIVVKDDATFNGVAIRATQALVGDITSTPSEGGIQLNSRAIEFRAPTGDAYGTSNVIFKAYTENGTDAQFQFKNPDAPYGMQILTRATDEIVLGVNVKKSGGAVQSISGNNGMFLQFDVSALQVWQVSNIGSTFVAQFGSNIVFNNPVFFSTMSNTINTAVPGISITNGGGLGLVSTSVTTHGVSATGGQDGVQGFSNNASFSGVAGISNVGGNGIYGQSTGNAGQFVGNVNITGTLSKGAGACLTLDTFRLNGNYDLKNGMLIVYDGTGYEKVRGLNKPIGNIEPCSVDMDKRVAAICTIGKEFITHNDKSKMNEDVWIDRFDQHCLDNGLSYSKEERCAYANKFDNDGDPLTAACEHGEGIMTSDYQEAFEDWYCDPDDGEIFYAAITGEYQTCLVDPQFGDIEPGDLICTSTTLGHGRKVLNSEKSDAIGCIVGKAITGRTSAEGAGPVSVFIMLS